MNYQLIRSQRKTLSLQIDKNAELLVRSPMRLSTQKIEAFITDKHSWIVKKQAEVKRKIRAKPSYKIGEKFLFLGEHYPLKYIDAGDPMRFDGNFFYLNTAFEPSQAFHWFYKKEFKKIALPKLEYYSQKYNLIFKQVRFKAQKTRWGSCSKSNNINLNYLLMMAPMSVVEMVIAHELTHIQHKNHSKDFYTLLKSIVPNYQQADIWLKEHSYQLHYLI